MHQNFPIRTDDSIQQTIRVLIAGGTANKQIAFGLGIRVRTADKHRQQIMDKLGIHEAADLTPYAISKGFVTVGIQTLSTPTTI